MDNGQKMEPPGMRAKRLGLERDAVSETYCCWLGRDRPYGASEGEIEHSKAISAKRIADALEKANEQVVDCVTVEDMQNDPMARIADALERLAGELARRG